MLVLAGSEHNFNLHMIEHIGDEYTNGTVFTSFHSVHNSLHMDMMKRRIV